MFATPTQLMEEQVGVLHTSFNSVYKQGYVGKIMNQGNYLQIYIFYNQLPDITNALLCDKSFIISFMQYLLLGTADHPKRKN